VIRKTDYMKITNLKVAIGMAGLLGVASMAHAYTIVPEPTDTYTFTAAKGFSTDFNGSTITIDGKGPGGVSSFSFFDSALSSTPYTSGDIKADLILAYGSLGWAGVFDVSIPLGVEPALVGDSKIEKSDSLQFTATGISLDAVTTYDPLALGIWTLDPAVGVPDAPNTFLLLLGVLAALTGVHYCNRPLVLAPARR
jgi:hypothetical protein